MSVKTKSVKKPTQAKRKPVKKTAKPVKTSAVVTISNEDIAIPTKMMESEMVIVTDPERPKTIKFCDLVKLMQK